MLELKIKKDEFILFLMLKKNFLSDKHGLYLEESLVWKSQ